VARSIEKEIDAFMKARIEQDPGFHALAAGGFKDLTPDAMNRLVWHTVGVHREAILRLASEIDNLSRKGEPDA
jgi:hypothetical protein